MDLKKDGWVPLLSSFNLHIGPFYYLCPFLAMNKDGVLQVGICSFPPLFFLKHDIDIPLWYGQGQGQGQGLRAHLVISNGSH